MAIVYQISLHGDAFDARGKDWAQIIAESGCKPDRGWKDPIHDRTLLKTEFGCSVSHFRVWQKIALSGVAGIVLEEDAVFASFDISEVDGLLKSYDSVWLGHRENTLGYWYNAHAYAISPKTASMLCEGFAQNIIPADEWLPLRLKNYSNYFYRPELVKQIPRSIRPSQIEKEARMPVHFITVGTDETQMWAIKSSAKAKNVPLINVAENVEWLGGSMVGRGGGQKINFLKNYIEQLEDHELVFFADGYDVLFLDDAHTIIERFRGFNCDILFAAERQCWPDATMADYFPSSETPYRFLNSGLYAGEVRYLKRFFNVRVGDDEDDQLWCQNRFLEYPEDLSIALDYEGYIFQCDDDVTVHNGQVFNGICAPCIYHGNGGPEAKNRMANLAGKLGFVERQVQIKKPLSLHYHKALEYHEAAKDILVTPLFSQEMCDEIIKEADALGKWEPMGGDKFPAQEIRVKDLGLWEDIENIWKDKLGKIAESQMDANGSYRAS